MTEMTSYPEIQNNKRQNKEKHAQSRLFRNLRGSVFPTFRPSCSKFWILPSGSGMPDNTGKKGRISDLRIDLKESNSASSAMLTKPDTQAMEVSGVDVESDEQA